MVKNKRKRWIRICDGIMGASALVVLGVVCGAWWTLDSLDKEGVFDQPLEYQPQVWIYGYPEPGVQPRVQAGDDKKTSSTTWESIPPVRQHIRTSRQRFSEVSGEV